MTIAALAGELTVTEIAIDGTPLDLGDVLADVVIRHGRSGFFDSASPSTCQLTILGVDHDFTRPFRLGSLLTVNATPAGGVEEPRFTGRFTDSGLDDDTLTAIAVGRLRTLSGYIVGATSYPEESWSARVTRIFTEAGLASILELEVGAFNPTLVARDPVEPEPVRLSEYLTQLAAMVDAAVCDRPDGTILVQPVSARTLTGLVEIDPGEISYVPEWTQRLPDANRIAITWGEPETPGTVEDEDTDSIALYGPIAVSVETAFKNEADAESVATDRLIRNAYAHWTIDDAPLLVGRSIPVGTPLELSGFPPAAPFDPWTPVLEGWTDRISARRGELLWTMNLALSDPLLSGLTLQWGFVPSDELWNTLPAALEWRDILTIGDLD